MCQCHLGVTPWHTHLIWNVGAPYDKWEILWNNWDTETDSNIREVIIFRKFIVYYIFFFLRSQTNLPKLALARIEHETLRKAHYKVLVFIFHKILYRNLFELAQTTLDDVRWTLWYTNSFQYSNIIYTLNLSAIPVPTGGSCKTKSKLLKYL